jgi:hypothetical protein
MLASAQATDSNDVPHAAFTPAQKKAVQWAIDKTTAGSQQLPVVQLEGASLRATEETRNTLIEVVAQLTVYPTEAESVSPRQRGAARTASSGAQQRIIQALTELPAQPPPGPRLALAALYDGLGRQRRRRLQALHTSFRKGLVVVMALDEHSRPLSPDHRRLHDARIVTVSRVGYAKVEYVDGRAPTSQLRGTLTLTPTA